MLMPTRMDGKTYIMQCILTITGRASRRLDLIPARDKAGYKSKKYKL